MVRAAAIAPNSTRRQRVLTALEWLVKAGEEVRVSSVARAADVDRSFLYRHHDLRARILTQAAEPDPPAVGVKVGRASLLADLVNLRADNDRLRQHNARLERRLSEVLGEEVFRAGGLGQAEDTEQLHRQVGELEQ